MNSLKVTAIVITNSIIFPNFKILQFMLAKQEVEPMTSQDSFQFCKPKTIAHRMLCKLLTWEQILTELLTLKGLRSPHSWMP